MSITIADIEAARRTIAGQVLRTPIARACVLCPKTNRRDEKMASEQPNNHSVGVQPGAQAGSRTRRRRLRLSRRAASRLRHARLGRLPDQGYRQQTGRLSAADCPERGGARRRERAEVARSPRSQSMCSGCANLATGTAHANEWQDVRRSSSLG